MLKDPKRKEKRGKGRCIVDKQEDGMTERDGSAFRVNIEILAFGNTTLLYSVL